MKRLLLALVIASTTLASPSISRAEDEESKIYDARLEGFNGKASMDNSSTALLWLFVVALGGLVVITMFKNAKRTHLD